MAEGLTDCYIISRLQESEESLTLKQLFYSRIEANEKYQSANQHSAITEAKEYETLLKGNECYRQKSAFS
jgi:hypothetical protein